MVGRRALQQGHIDGQGAGTEQAFDFAQEDSSGFMSQTCGTRL